MPFTISHVAAVIPFRSRLRFLNFPALVIGSLVPDFGYFFPLNDYFNENAHTYNRSFTFCLPIGLILLCIFYSLRRSFVLTLPKPHNEVLLSLITTKGFTTKNFILGIPSILLGTWSHIIWDSFTHKSGYFVEKYSFLNLAVWQSPSSSYFVYNALQHFSSVIGLTYLLLVYIRWMRTQNVSVSKLNFIQNYRILIIITLASILSCYVYVYPNFWPETFLEFRILAFKVITKFIQSFLIIMTTIALLSLFKSKFKT